MARPFTYAPRYRRSQGFVGGYGYGYGSPFGYISEPYDSNRGRTAGDEERIETGYLLLDIQPSTAQVYVDGYYVGVATDFRSMSAGRALASGPHRIEIRADGYETYTVDVRIAPNESVTLRRILRADTRPPTPIVQAKPKTFYVIPGCYAGDKRPNPERLSSKCKVASVRVVPPVVQ